MSIGESADDYADLQRQVLDRRAELVRAANVQASRAPMAPDLLGAWNDLASRAWDFGHESYAWIGPAAQDDRGRKLLGELAVMRGRFEVSKVAPDAMPSVPAEAAPPVNPEHASPFSLASLWQGGEELVILAVLAALALGARRA